MKAAAAAPAKPGEKQLTAPPAEQKDRDRDRNRAERMDVLKRAQVGDEKVLPRLREMIAEDPEAYRIDLADSLTDSLLRDLAPKDLLTREQVRVDLHRKRAQLRGQSPTPLEALLADRVLVCWFQLQCYDLAYTQGRRDLTLAQSESQQKRLDGAHKRYLSAIKTLAQVRRLQLPPAPVQVNVAAQGGQQVNLAAGCRACDTEKSGDTPCNPGNGRESMQPPGKAG